MVSDKNKRCFLNILYQIIRNGETLAAQATLLLDRDLNDPDDLRLIKTLFGDITIRTATMAAVTKTFRNRLLDDFYECEEFGDEDD